MKKIRILPILFFGAIVLTGLLVFTARKEVPSEADNSSSATFSKSVDDLEASTESELIELKNGDTFGVTAKAIKHKINGQEIRMLSYNGSIPGPTIIVTEGDKITLDITNNLDVETTIHPHGVNGDSASDGVPDISQAPIGVGESYQQTIRFPEPGLFWYHPHIREDYTQASGMYANFIVKPKDDKTWPKADKVQMLQLSDISMTEDGLLEFEKERVTHKLMGRFGNIQTVNGKTDYVLNMKQNEVNRLYITNTSSARSYKFEIPGVELKLIGGDNGLYETDNFTDSITIAPSERSIVDVMFTEPGSYTIQNNNPESNTELAKINVEENTTASDIANSFTNLTARQEQINKINQLLRDAENSGIYKRLATKVDMNPKFMQSMMQEMMRSDGMMQGQDDHGGIEWEDNMPEANSRSDTETTKWSLLDLDNPRDDNFEWTFNQNDVVTISVNNDKKAMHPMQHPVHLHGQKFIVKSINGVPTKNRVFKDVVQVPVGDTYELVVSMDNIGTWLLHCHIPEHMESGMVGKFIVK